MIDKVMKNSKIYEMNNVLLLVCVMSIISLCSCSVVKVHTVLGKYRQGELICDIHVFNSSKDTLVLPSQLIVTPDKNNTINGVIELLLLSKKDEYSKVKSQEIDFDIPMTILTEKYLVTEKESIVLPPSFTHVYSVDFTPFYRSLGQGTYLLKIDSFTLTPFIEYNENLSMTFVLSPDKMK